MEEIYWIYLAISILTILFVFLKLRKDRCPMCNKYMTVRTVGRTKLETYTRTDSQYVPEKRHTKYYTYTYQKTIVHKKCSHCNYTFDEKDDILIDVKHRFV